jgi:hypothetical protein
MIGRKRKKWSSFQSRKLLFRAYFKTAAALNKRVLPVIWLRRRQQRRSKQEKYKKSIWIRNFSRKDNGKVKVNTTYCYRRVKATTNIFLSNFMLPSKLI